LSFDGKNQNSYTSDENTDFMPIWNLKESEWIKVERVIAEDIEEMTVEDVDKFN